MPEGEVTEADVIKAEKILKNMRANEHAFVIYPDGYEIGFRGMKASTTRDPSNSHSYHYRQIYASVLAQFLQLGSAGGGATGGSRALSQDHSEMFLQSIETAARYLRHGNFCLSFDGRIVENNDSIARTGPVHSNCRGIWVAIMKDEAELSKISGVPKSVSDRIGDTVNDVEQPKEPIVKRGSPGANAADKRPE